MPFIPLSEKKKEEVHVNDPKLEEGEIVEGPSLTPVVNPSPNDEIKKEELPLLPPTLERQNAEENKTSTGLGKDDIYFAQYCMAKFSIPRLSKWLKKVHSVDISKYLKEFDNYQKAEMDKLGLNVEVPFGKYKGRSYLSVWSEKDGRDYLEWVIKQDWCYEDTKAAVRGLKKNVGDYSKFNKNKSKQNKSKKRKTPASTPLTEKE